MILPKPRKKIRHVDKRKLMKNKEQAQRYSKLRQLDCNKCGAPNWSKQHECPARGKKCNKCGKLGHYAKCCRSTSKINHISVEEADSADEVHWIPISVGVFPKMFLLPTRVITGKHFPRLRYATKLACFAVSK